MSGNNAPSQGQQIQAASDDDVLDVSKRLLAQNREAYTELANGSANQKPDDNPAVRALKEFQLAMAGEAERAGIMSEDDVVALVMAGRKSH